MLLFVVFLDVVIFLTVSGFLTALICDAVYLGKPELLKSLSKCQCIHLKENLYLFSYYDEILKHIGEKSEIDFSKKTRTLQEIKKF